jgi:hypothetical protein
MQRVGLDRIDLARRPPRASTGRPPQQQAAEARNQHGAQRLDARLAGKPLRDADVEQQRVQAADRHAHRQHHQAPMVPIIAARTTRLFRGANERP